MHSYTNDQEPGRQLSQIRASRSQRADEHGRRRNRRSESHGRVLPHLNGVLAGNAIRVPIPNMSLAILKLNLKRETTVAKSMNTCARSALHSPLRKQIDYSNSRRWCQTDMVGSRHACIFDAEATMVDGSTVVLYCWYNETDLAIAARCIAAWRKWLACITSAIEGSLIAAVSKAASGRFFFAQIGIVAMYF